jgi:hypothetical protein
MASTGLLGINPYQKGVVFDISSKPINLAIQLEQKEAAKKEALDKYFMDYEKTLNPVGVRQQDQDVFLGKLNKAKSYYLQNRDKILNPSRYGAAAQSEYMAQLRDAQAVIGRSKQAAEEEKSFKTYIDQLHKSGKAFDEKQISEILSNSRKPVGFGYVAPDSTMVEVWNQYDPMKVLSKINTLKRVEGRAKPEMLSKVTYQDVSPLDIDKDQAKTLAYSELSDKGYRKALELISQDPEEVKRLSKFVQLPDPKSKDYLPALSYAHILSQAPTIYDRSGVKFTPAEEIRQSLAKQRGSTALENTQNLVNYINNGLGFLQGDGDQNAVNNYFSYFKSQNKGAIGGDIGFTNVQKLSPGVWKFNYNVSKDGVAIPTSTVIRSNDPAAKNQLFALSQQFVGSNAKAEATMIPKPGQNTNPTPKKEKTWAERQAELKNKKK